MTDQELLQLIEQKTPHELSLDELRLLKQRLAESPLVRDALAGQLRMDGNLAAALGRVDVSADAILARASGAPRRRHRLFTVVITGVASLIAIFVLVIAARRTGQDEPSATLAQASGAVANGNRANDKFGSPADTSNATATASDSAVGTPSATPANSHEPPAVGDAAGVEPLTIEAESFARGNVVIDSSRFGSREITVVRADNQSPNFVEYDIDIPRGGAYRLRLRYATNDQRPLRLSINGRPAAGAIAEQSTGGEKISDQKWHTVGDFAFGPGKNVLRLESARQFPYLDTLVLVPVALDPVVAPAVVAAAPPPWHEVLAESYQPPAFADVCFETFDVTKSLPQRDDLQKWFEPVPGQSLRIVDTRTAFGQCAAFEGLVRLKAPLGDDRALRVWVENYHRLQIHLFSGERGVSLTFHEDDYFRWSAYSTTRAANSPLPKTWALTATDDNRNRRTEIRGGGPMELRHRDGEVILSRGDVVLLRAPLDGSPQDVYFAGRATFHGIGLVRTRTAPGGAEADREGAQGGQMGRLPYVPTELVWQEQLGAGARIEKLPDGAVRLVADGAKARGWSFAALPNIGLHEIILRLDDVTSGTGISLSRDGERAGLTLRFLTDKRSNGLALVPRADDDAREDSLPAVADHFVPLTTRSPWVKLIVGPGIIRWWISVDGAHWAEWQQPLTNIPAGLTQLGLHHVAAAPECRLTLKSISLRPLDAIVGAADTQLVQRAPVLLDSKDLESWLKTVAEQQPTDVSPADWRCACAVRALAGGCAKPVGPALVLFLLHDSLERDRPLAEQLRLAEQLLQIADLRENAQYVADLAKHLHKLGVAAFERHRQRPFSAVRHTLLAAPFHTPHVLPVAEPQLIRTELLQLLYASRWQDAVEFCRQLRFFRLHEQAPLVDWADALARRESPGREPPDPAADLRPEKMLRGIRRRPSRGERDAIVKQKGGWQHPYVEELSKETYNTLAELQGILDSAAYDDAAKMIAALSPELMTGVAPTADDDRLLVSIPAAIRLAVNDHPPLQAAMDLRYGAIAQLRVRQAINTGNVAAVELAAVQFAATDAAAEARQWLGDRALAMGWFARAAAEYRQAAATAGPNLRDAVQARTRLTAAMLGDDVGSPVTRAVQMGDRQLSPAEFEGLVADLRQREQTVRGERRIATGGNPVGPAPRHSPLTAQVRGPFDGPVGEAPLEEVTRNVTRFKVDWAGRQLATAIDGEWLIVSNRFQVAAYDLRNGQRLWQSAPPAGLKMLKARDWTGVAMRPLVTSQAIFVRQLFGDGPVLTCLDKQTGKLLWLASDLKNQFIASDPVFVQDRLFALTMARSDPLELTLRLSAFDPETGDVISHFELLHLRSGWQLRHNCEVTALDDAVVVSLAGVLLCCDTSGNVRWIRKQVVLPPDEEPEWITQWFDPPLGHDGRLFVTAPGVRTVDCVQPETGKLLWNAVIPDVRRLAGIADGRLFVLTDAGVQCLDAADGQRLWTHAATDILSGQLCGGDGGFLLARSMPGPAGKKPRPELVWLDPQSGAPRGSALLDSLEDDDPRLGPLVNFNGHLWTFFGRGPNEPKRDFIELVPN